MDTTRPLTPTIAAVLSAIDAAVDSGERLPSLAALGRLADTTPARVRTEFLVAVGLTPKTYAAARRAERLRDSLAGGVPVADALFSAGYGSVSRVYERHGELLGMTPAAYRHGAPGELIRYAFADSTLGRVIVGLTETGVCFIAFGDDESELLQDLAARFPRAEIASSSGADAALVEAVVALIDDPMHTEQALPLDVRGTAFQQRVWAALTRIAPGETVTYAELARRIGQPTAVRAVAQACGSNPVAVAVPCHRVVGSDGSLTGYRWGLERKRELLRREVG